MQSELSARYLFVEMLTTFLYPLRMVLSPYPLWMMA